MGIYSKLLEIQRSVRALLPNADGNNYKYISGSKVLGIVRPTIRGTRRVTQVVTRFGC